MEAMECTNVEAEEEEEEGGGNGNSHGESENCQSADNSGISFRIDPEDLNCPLCRKPLQPPIFQCINGHFACSRCCKKLHNDCPVCAHTIGSIRCLPLEFVIGSIEISCSYARFECKEIITFIIDPDDLNCPICRKPLQPPIFQCIYGHFACSRCCKKLRNDCPVCAHNIGSIRCLPLEFVIGSIKICCPYARFGCKEIITYTGKKAHKNAPRICFNYGCSFRVSLQRKQLFYILHGWDQDGRILLLVNNHLCSCCGASSSGNALSVVCIGPGNAARDLHYELEVEGGNANTLILKGSPENVRKWREDYLPKFSLYVSNEHSGSSGIIVVNVCIRKGDGRACTRTAADRGSLG